MTLVAIPAYRPDERLVALVHELLGHDVSLAVVDDGSGPNHTAVFAALSKLGIPVLTHTQNRGKGAALRTLFAFATEHHPDEVVVTADADGQHLPEDILRVAQEADAESTIVLGVRRFDGPEVPRRSRIGNAVSDRLFQALTGTRLGDTQTGLRALPPAAVRWALGLPGDRFEYEAVMLLRARSGGFQLRTTPIRTVYLDHNRTSSFRPLRDSIRVLAPMLGYAASSASAAVIDALALWLLVSLTGALGFSVVVARLISATVNFTVNRRWVFRDRARTAPLRRELLRYASLATAILIANLTLMTALDALGVGLVLAKILTEGTLWIASFVVQRLWVFARPRTSQVHSREFIPLA